MSSLMSAVIGLGIPSDAAAAMIRMKVFIARVFLANVVMFVKTGLLLYGIFLSHNLDIISLLVPFVKIFHTYDED